jgi:hypothetical protein
MNNLTNIDISNYKSLIVQGINSSILVTNGKGIYSDIYFNKNYHQKNSELKIVFSNNGNNQTILTGISNNKLNKFADISNIVLNSESPVHILIRQPQLNIYGNVSLSNLIANLDYTKTGYMPGKDLTFFGNISMFLYLSDSYSAATGFHVDKKGNFLKPKISYNYFTGLIPESFSLSTLYSLPLLDYILLTIPIIIAFSFIFTDLSKKGSYFK